jgi:hypothetical protein
MNIFKYWLANPHVIIGNDVLAQINDFAVRVDSSEIMKELAFQVMEAISQRVRSFLLLRTLPSIVFSDVAKLTPLPYHLFSP